MELLKVNGKAVIIRLRSRYNNYLAACEDKTSVNQVPLVGNEKSTMWTLEGENPGKAVRFVSVYNKYLAAVHNSDVVIQTKEESSLSYTWWKVENSSKGFPHIIIRAYMDDSGHLLLPRQDDKVGGLCAGEHHRWLMRKIIPWVIEIVGYRALSNSDHYKVSRGTTSTITHIGQQVIIHYHEGTGISTYTSGNNTNGSGTQTVGGIRVQTKIKVVNNGDFVVNV